MKFWNRNSLVSLIVVFLSCQSDSKQQKEMTVSLKFEPRVSQTYKFELTSETQVSQEIRGNTIQNDNKISYAIAYFIKGDSSNLTNISVTFDKFTVESTSNGETMKLDASTAISSPDPTARKFGALHKGSVQICVDSTGKLIQLKGFDQLSNRIQQAASGDPTALSIYSSSIKQYFNEDFIKQMSAGLSYTFDKQLLKTGSTWTDSTEVPDFAGVYMKSDYKLVSLDSFSIVVAVNSYLDIDREIVIQGRTTQAKLEGKQKGDIIIETTTGLVKKSEVSFNMKGKINVLGMDVPIKINANNSVKRLSF